MGNCSSAHTVGESAGAGDLGIVQNVPIKLMLLGAGESGRCFQSFGVVNPRDI